MESAAVSLCLALSLSRSLVSLCAANELCGVKWATTTNKFHMRHKLQSMRDFDFPNEAISCYPLPSPLPTHYPTHCSSSSPNNDVNRNQRSREPESWQRQLQPRPTQCLTALLGVVSPRREQQGKGEGALHGWQQLRKFAQRRRRQQVRAHFNSQQ